MSSSGYPCMLGKDSFYMSSPDQYRVVFDFTEKGFQWWFPAVGLIFVTLGGLLIWLGRRNQWRLLRRVVGYYMVGFSLLWFSMTPL